MAYDYDKLYGETPDALGPPTQIIVDFFDSLSLTSARVLDIGCGQGRDALFIARLGHHVTGVDLSPNGISDLNAVATRDALSVTGIVADITTFTPDGTFDIVLIDRTLHMLDAAPRNATFARLLNHVAPEGWVLVSDEAPNIPAFLTAMETHTANWRIDHHKRGYLFAQRA